MKRVRVLVSGEVQGVFFRDNCEQMAGREGVTGWVRNLPDGRVEAVFEGSEDAVDRLVAWANHGPEQAGVTDVETHVEAPTGESGFEVR